MGFPSRPDGRTTIIARGTQQEDDRRVELPDVGGREAIDDAEQHAGQERAGHAAEPADDRDDQREGRELDPERRHLR